MDLSVNPYTIIPRPSFTGKEANEDIARQWDLWRKSVGHARDVFKKLQNKRKAMGPDSDNFKSFLGTLKLSGDFVQKNLRDDLSLTAAVSGESIVEGAKRFRLWCEASEFYNIDDDGYLLPWERDLDTVKKGKK